MNIKNFKKESNILLDVSPIKVKTLFSYSKYYDINLLKNKFKVIFNKKNVFFFKDARSSIYQSLKLIGLKKSDEVIIPSYACNPIKLAVKQICKTAYVDINSNDSNINPEGIYKKLSPRTKAIIVIHTYGKASEMDKILTIAKKYNLFIIEDLAQGIGGKYNGRYLGTFGDFTILSFALHKDITSLYGGALISNNTIPELDKLQNNYKSINIFYKLLIVKIKEMLRKNNKKYLKYDLEKYIKNFLSKDKNKQIC
jgi:dTDP-4-amino-4,6-dideoxygalactose transaminase